MTENPFFILCSSLGWLFRLSISFCLYYIRSYSLIYVSLPRSMQNYYKLLLLVLCQISCIHCQDAENGHTYNYYSTVIVPYGNECSGDDGQSTPTHDEHPEQNTMSWSNCQKGERGVVGKAGPKVIQLVVCVAFP